jgi:hypothetical protein
MLYLLIPLLQIICVVHVVKTGRPFMWIYVLLFLPGLGVAAYAIVEILPGFFGSRAAHNLRRSAVGTLDPGRELRHRRQALEEADTVDNRRLLAEALLADGKHAEALELYRGTLTGIHADDPGMLLGMARAAYGVGDYDLALSTVLQLGETNPRYQPVEAQLLHAWRSKSSAATTKRPTITPHSSPTRPARRCVAATRCCSSAAATATRRRNSSTKS